MRMDCALIIIPFCRYKWNATRGMPLLGYAPFLSTKEPLFRVMQKMAKTYGPVTGFYLGPSLAFISVDGPKAAKEALHNNDLNGRPSGSVVISIEHSGRN
jgi:hypothetical protein